MAERDWDLFIWSRANDLLQKAERIQRNFLQIAAATQYRSWQRRAPSWEPPVNIIETDESLWVITAIPGVSSDQVHVRIEGGELVITGHRPLPKCCTDGDLKIWEIPLGHFERRVNVIAGKNPLFLGEIKLQEGLLIIELRKGS